MIKLAQSLSVKLFALPILACLILILLAGLGFRFDPFDLTARRADRAETQASTATTEALARGIEASGERDTSARVDGVVRQITAANQASHILTSDARSALDATAPLAPERAERLHAFDQQLCASRPVLCPDRAPAPDHARDSEPALPAGRSPTQ